MDFKQYYTNFLNQGYRSTFIKEKLAAHCGVSIHTIDSWLKGSPVRKTYFILLESFKIGGEQ